MRSIFPKAGWMLAGVLALYVLSALAGVVTGGPLDPPGAPGPTMKALDDLPPSWHQLLPSNDGDGGGCNSTRFQCVLGSAAVLDHETGLVWQRTVAAGSTNFSGAYADCEFIEIGGRYGWRVPSHQELRSLLDTSPDHLPDGHPFIGVLTGSPDLFWTTAIFLHAGTESTVIVLNVDAPADITVDPETDLNRRWCVRGGTEWDLRN